MSSVVLEECKEIVPVVKEKTDLENLKIINDRQDLKVKKGVKIESEF